MTTASGVLDELCHLAPLSPRMREFRPKVGCAVVNPPAAVLSATTAAHRGAVALLAARLTGSTCMQSGGELNDGRAVFVKAAWNQVRALKSNGRQRSWSR